MLKVLTSCSLYLKWNAHEEVTNLMRINQAGESYLWSQIHNLVCMECYLSFLIFKTQKRFKPKQGHKIKIKETNL